MMKYTFLDFIQKTLSAIDSQNVSSAGDSTESEQVGLIINRIYFDILSRRDWPNLKVNGINLTTLGTNAWELDLPSNCMTLKYITYNSKELTYKDPISFKYMVESRDTTASNVNSSGIYTDKDPIYWTSYDDATITFDAYDSTYANLLPSLCYVQYIKSISSELSADSDVPDLPARFHSVMLDGVLATAFLELAQESNKAAKKEADYKRGMARMKKWARRIEQTEPTYKTINYGRSSR